MKTPFIKMNGAGNDFVILDARNQPLRLNGKQVQAIAARDNPVTKGCDQVIVLETPRHSAFSIQHSREKAASPDAKSGMPPPDVFMRIYNADGGEVGACGNATRCVGYLIYKETGRHEMSIGTKAGQLDCLVADEMPEVVIAYMGKPRLGWQDIPLSHAADTLHLPVIAGPLSDPVGVSMGNPHAVFFVPDAQSIDLAALGPKLEHHPLFPERANISVAQIHDEGDITLRVWERGAGETLACGTAACATLVAAHLRGLASKEARIRVKGGELIVEWSEDGQVCFHGLTETEFAGELEL